MSTELQLHSLAPATQGPDQALESAWLRSRAQHTRSRMGRRARGLGEIRVKRRRPHRGPGSSRAAHARRSVGPVRPGPQPGHGVRVAPPRVFYKVSESVRASVRPPAAAAAAACVRCPGPSARVWTPRSPPAAESRSSPAPPGRLCLRIAGRKRLERPLRAPCCGRGRPIGDDPGRARELRGQSENRSR